MCHNATIRWIVLGLAALSAASAQTPPPGLEWRRVGNAALDLALPSLATGFVPRVWYAADGNALFAQTADGRIWNTQDFENWKSAPGAIAPTKIRLTGRVPGETDIRLETAPGARRQYAIGRFVHRSDDGLTWNNLTAYRGESILGDSLADLAISPRDADEITVSNQFGIWRSLDAGVTWAGLNEGLPNHPASRILSVPSGLQPARLLIPSSSTPLEVEWMPGERTAWRIADAKQTREETALRLRFGQQLNATISRVEISASWIYAGATDGRMFISQNQGQTWAAANVAQSGSVRSIYINPADPRIAVAAFSSSTARVFRTYNGGQDWYDATGNLPPADAFGVTVEPASGSVYLATTAGVFQAQVDLQNLTLAPAWTKISQGLPDAAALDLKLDENGNQIFVLLQGYGVYATMAPHRMKDLRVVNAADFSTRPAAPGSLLSILGSRIDRARTADMVVPVLGATDSETQIQVPFEAKGGLIQLTVETAGATRNFGLPLAPVSPAIFLDRDGTPLLLDADSGMALDASNPAKSGTRIQILAAGLGAVSPNWPTGVPAPENNTPRVTAPIRVFVDREPVAVTRATLAPGYIGFYLVEVQLPKIVNAGPAELFLEAGPEASNRVRLYLLP